jgi:hypothetical protein
LCLFTHIPPRTQKSMLDFNERDISLERRTEKWHGI